MRSVVEGYKRDGLFDRWNIRLIATHNEGSALTRLRYLVVALIAFLKLLACRRVSLVHIHVAMKGSFWRKSLFVAIARVAGVPVVLHLHGSEFAKFYQRQPSRIQAEISNIFAKADMVLALSDSWRQFILRVSPTARVEVMPNYVSLPSLNTSKAGREVRVLFLGLVGERKGIYDLLPAFGQALTVRADLHLIVGGNGEIETGMEKARELGIADRVSFLGWVGGAERDSELARADIFVLPSHNEGLPMSVLEAMAFGKPVVSTCVGGIPELVRDGVDGYVVNPGDVTALAKAIVGLANDVSLRTAMGSSGRARVLQGYSMAAVLPRLDALYRRLISEQPAHIALGD